MSVLSEALTTLFKKPPPIVKPTGEVYALGQLLPVKFSAMAVAAVIVGGGFFYMRSRRRPLPPTYPYPPYPMPPAYQMPAMACPACCFPVYPGEFVCRRCGFRVR
jgi:hypothetical protein